jgi:vacuolar-type H+-ATPase subunit I/STV1
MRYSVLRTKPVSTGEAMAAALVFGFIGLFVGYILYGLAIMFVHMPWTLAFIAPFIVLFIIFRFTELGRKAL